jgi:hypothetical protein
MSIREEADRIVFVGPGVMAEALASGLIERAGVAPRAIVMTGPRAERLAELAARHGVSTTGDSRAAVAGADVVVLAVKPQSLEEVFRGLRGAVSGNTVVLSIVAGARLSAIREGLGHDAVVRSMPNTPAQVGEGITVWAASEAVTPGQRALAREILAACGEEIFVENEDYLDMATAVSGTWSMPECISVSPAEWRNNLSFKRCVDRWSSTATRPPISPDCGTRSPRREGRRLRPCTTWRRPASARRFPERSGPRTNGLSSWDKGRSADRSTASDRVIVNGWTKRMHSVIISG